MQQQLFVNLSYSAKSNVLVICI